MEHMDRQPDHVHNQDRVEFGRRLQMAHVPVRNNSPFSLDFSTWSSTFSFFFLSVSFLRRFFFLFSAVSCPAAEIEFGSYPITAVGTVKVGTCIAGYYGTPERNCSSINATSASWSSDVVNSCVEITCPLVNTTSGILLVTQAGLTVNGTCQFGYSGNPYATCYQSNTDFGIWGTIANTCQREFLLFFLFSLLLTQSLI